MINITQVNLHKSTQATVLLGNEIGGKSGKLAFVTEPYISHGTITGIPNGTTIVQAISKGAPRAGIIASKDLGITAMDGWCTQDFAVATIRLGDVRALLVSAYLDIKLPVKQNQLENILNMANGKNYPVILCMDSNAHSTLYGPTNNQRGDELEDVIMRHALRVENVGECPTFETMRGQRLIQTHIDVTLTRGIDLLNWRVDREYNGSDHNTIRCEITVGSKEKESIRPWSKADWQKFRTHLDQADYKIPGAMSMKKLDKLTKRLYLNLESALDAACPRILITPKAGTNTWVTTEHVTAKKKVSELYKKAKKSCKQNDWDAYKLADKTFKNKCKNDKNKAWRQYKEGIQTEKEVAKLTRLAQRQERRDINVMKRDDGSLTDPGKETIDILTKTHFPAASGVRHVTYNNRRNCTTEVLRAKYKSWITNELIVQALGEFEKKSPGPDGLKPLVFEHLTEKFIDTLNLIYKAAIHLGYTPRLWRETKVIYIAKPGKESYEKPKSFRPISLSNYLLKGLERLVGWNMDKALKDNPIHPKQHGFLTGKSTESAISNTTDFIEKYVMNKQHCVGIFLDISAAFDSIRPGHVRQALLKHGGEPEMVQWYHNYMSHRDIIVTMHGETMVFSTGVGFPQGGVCSAKFWLVAFDYAIQIINRYNIEGNGYADDCSALYGGPRIDHALKRLQKMLDELTEWGRTCGLKFNPEKSIAVIFTRRRKQPPFKLKIDGKEIEFQTQVKYLGVTLDSKLYWTRHIDEKIKSAKRYLSLVNNITRDNWGPKPKLMRWAYLGIVRPMICYGSLIWGHRAPESIAKLRRVNRLAMNTFANFPKSTPTQALEVMLDVMPLHTFVEQEALAARLRLDNVLRLEWSGKNSNKTHSVSHLRYWKDALETGKINYSNPDRCDRTRYEQHFVLDRTSFDGAPEHRTRLQFSAYTDGSRKDDQTGSGYVIYEGEVERESASFRLPNYATVFQAEIKAVERAALAARNLWSDEMKVVKFFVDSQAALLALGKGSLSSKSVADAVLALNDLAKLTRVQLAWIPAHKGHEGNERADELAKIGSESNDRNAFLNIGRPSASVRAELGEFSYRKWNEEWGTSKGMHHSKTFYGGPSSTKARYVYKLARLELGRFVRIITGHNNLNFFQAKIGLQTVSSCRLCGEGPETVTHLMSKCPRLLGAQREILGGLMPKSDMSWSVRSLLDFSYTPGVNEAFEGSDHNDPPTPA